MNQTHVEQLARAVLYEGYILYPYRPSAIKNQQRFNFGVLAPQSYSTAQGGTESWMMQTECLALGGQQSVLDLKVRFLHLRERTEAGKPAWQEAVEREADALELNLQELPSQPQQVPIFFPAAQETEFLREASGQVTGEIVRRQEAIEGTLIVRGTACEARGTAQPLFKLTVSILNQTPFAHATRRTRNEALLQSLVSTHTILSISGGEFISLLDPPAEFRAAAAACRNHGTWPVLAGAEGERNLLLSSPIILYDYPQLAPESPGDFFDGAEIDELLTLRILTLTEEEKQEMREADEHARQLLERTETGPEEYLRRLHGTVRGLRPVARG